MAIWQAPPLISRHEDAREDAIFPLPFIPSLLRDLASRVVRDASKSKRGGGANERDLAAGKSRIALLLLLRRRPEPCRVVGSL